MTEVAFWQAQTGSVGKDLRYVMLRADFRPYSYLRVLRVEADAAQDTSGLKLCEPVVQISLWLDDDPRAACFQTSAAEFADMCREWLKQIAEIPDDKL